MDDYISREAAIKALEKLNPSEFTMEIFKAIKEVPAADVEPVRYGRWINKKGGFWDVAQCSVCGSSCPTAGIPPRYCQSCGAKMDLEDEK